VIGDQEFAFEGRGPSRTPDGMRRGAPAAEFRPRPRDAGEYLPHQTQLSSGTQPEGEQRRTRGEQVRGGRTDRVSGQRDYAAARRVAENPAPGPPAGGLCAATGQSPRCARFFSNNRGATRPPPGKPAFRGCPRRHGLHRSIRHMPQALEGRHPQCPLVVGYDVSSDSRAVEVRRGR